MEITASISFEQYKTALAALQAPTTGRPNKTKRPYKAFGISALIAISFLLADYAHGARDNAAIAFVALFLLYGLCLALKQWGKVRHETCLKKVYEAQEKQLSGQLMSINEQGISGSTADLTYAYQYRWASFVRLIDLSDGLLFLPNSVSFVHIPKESLSSEELRQIMAWWTPYATRTQ